jgi:hypothetical protein
MFGFLYTLFVTLGYIKKEFTESIENNECKQIYKNIDGLTYTDTKGCSRLLSTNELVFYTHLPNGDYILEDLSGKVIKNFTLENRQRKQIELKNEAAFSMNSTYCIDENNYKNDYICKGKRFKDLKTGDIYVIRNIKGRYYYMDIKSGLLVRKTDWQIRREQEGMVHPKLPDINIEEFNKKQKLITNNQALLYRNFDYYTAVDYCK